MSAINIYDFETALEVGAADALTALGLAAIHPGTEPDFQQVRPRVEVEFQVGAAKRSYHTVNGGLRNASWGGTLSLYIVTAADAVGKMSHRSYRAMVRKAMGGLKDAINAVLTHHKVQGIYDQGTSNEYKTEQGYEVSKLEYAVDFGVDYGAWVEIDS